MIPRIVHRIWLGSEPLPEAYVRYGETWRRHHPGWSMRLWTDADLPPLRLTEGLSGHLDLIKRSDIIRLEVLSRFGGLYVDTDMECRRSFEPLMGSPFVYRTDDAVQTAVMAFPPGHSALEEALDAIPGRVAAGVRSSAGGRFLAPVFARYPDIAILPREWFEPYGRKELGREHDAFPDAYSIHRWHTGRAGKALARAQRRLERAERRLVRERERGRRAERRGRTSARKLEQVEASLWWRLGVAVRAVRPRRSGRGRR